MPVVLRRHAAVRAGRAGDRSRRRRRVPVLRARSPACRSGDSPLARRLPRAEVRRPQPGAGGPRPPDLGRRRARHRLPLERDASGQHLRRPPAAGLGAARPRRRRAARAQAARCCTPTSPTGSTSPTTTCWPTLAGDVGLDAHGGRVAAGVRRRGRLRARRAGRGLRQRHHRGADLRDRGRVDAPGRPRDREVGQGPHPHQRGARHAVADRTVDAPVDVAAAGHELGRAARGG